MYYRRNEAFRYSFEPNLAAKFIANTSEQTKGELHILDISLHGMKVNLPAHPYQKGDKIFIQFMLVNQQFDVDGEIVWLKPLGKKVQAGVQLSTTESVRKQLVDQLKVYAKKKNDSAG
ncbi:PilZ domain-containing protein [Thalassobacillus cyri]|uniref:PilZ domain-containing protein n=1 Tax=Thalassobacillus cyri TaxID=571932 RepID=A0A1H4D6C4_9BACI|nr:PilZ domain-containing protein [Thalassobacillus cyri]SEA68211.1 PilZ domain-containing protein [Thalassobacillus cyri]